MKTGYDSFFRAAKKARKPGMQTMGKRPVATHSEDELRKILKVRGRRSKRPLAPIWGLAGLGLICAGLGLWAMDPDWPNQIATDLGLSKIEIGWLSQGVASEKTDSPKSEVSKAKAKDSLKANPDSPQVLSSPKSDEIPEHLVNLKARSDMLDLREKELNQLEEEINNQRVQIEERIKKLEAVRDQIAVILKDRIEVDQERVGKLVETYSGMKPKQAAEIMSGLDEDLAIEILGKMKKKNAAEILNLIEPAKARSLSEKYAGYRKN